MKIFLSDMFLGSVANSLEQSLVVKSLEKYRPSFYEAGPPKESGDINDIRDYYTNMLTRQRALTRFTGYHNQYNNDYDNHGGETTFETVSRYQYMIKIVINTELRSNQYQ